MLNFKAFWTVYSGSNTHNNGRPAGDGQAGDAGEGRAGKIELIYKIDSRRNKKLLKAFCIFPL